MNGGILPILILCACVGLALGNASQRSALTGFAALALTAGAVALLPIGETMSRPLFAGLWLSAIATAALVYLPRELPGKLAVATGVNGGAWAGALASATGMRGDLVAALPIGLLFALGQWLRLRGYAIVFKVLASWLIAVASLSAFVSLMPTPGYESDHME